MDGEFKIMTLQQEAYERIDKLSDDGIRLLINIIDNIQVMSVSGFKRKEGSDANRDDSSDIVDTLNVESLGSLTKKEKKELFLKSAGKMRIDSHAIQELRERSMI